jgi:hypothetical protein
MRGLPLMLVFIGVVRAVAAAIFLVRIKVKGPRGSGGSSLPHDQHDGGDLPGQGQSRHFRPGSATAQIGPIEGMWQSRFKRRRVSGPPPTAPSALPAAPLAVHALPAFAGRFLRSILVPILEQPDLYRSCGEDLP